MRKATRNPRYADDATESVSLLLKFRLPWLAMGVALSLCTAVLVSKFEHILSADPALVFFIPLIIYMSDSVGTQTATIYIRNLNKKQARFHIYMIKELLIGISLGLFFGLFVALATHFWLHKDQVALTVGTAMAVNLTTATVFSLLTTATMNRLGVDPASGVDPIVSVFQDVISISIYLVVATLILF